MLTLELCSKKRSCTVPFETFKRVYTVCLYVDCQIDHSFKTTLSIDKAITLALFELIFNRNASDNSHFISYSCLFSCTISNRVVCFDRNRLEIAIFRFSRGLFMVLKGLIVLNWKTMNNSSTHLIHIFASQYSPKYSLTAPSSSPSSWNR